MTSPSLMAKRQASLTATFVPSMEGHHNFIEKAFCLVMNGKKMIGDDLEKGLAQLKTVAESDKAASNN
jgi:hypothetical protein